VNLESVPEPIADINCATDGCFPIFFRLGKVTISPHQRLSSHARFPSAKSPTPDGALDLELGEPYVTPAPAASTHNSSRSSHLKSAGPHRRIDKRGERLTRLHDVR